MELNAKNLKDKLWNNLQGIESGDVQLSQADGMATQAREILRTVKIELEIAKQSGQSVSDKLKAFPEA